MRRATGQIVCPADIEGEVPRNETGEVLRRLQKERFCEEAVTAVAWGVIKLFKEKYFNERADGVLSASADISVWNILDELY